MTDYPSNSQRPKPAAKAVPEKKVERVTTGGAKRRKKPLGRRFSEVFTGDDTTGVMEYVFLDVLIPAAKDMVADAVSQGVERKLFGEVRGRGRSTIRSGLGGGAGWTPYNRPPAAQPRMSRQARAQHNFDELVCDTRIDAENILNGLESLIAEYEAASVRDLYELAGEQSSYTDEKYGWTDLAGSGVRRVRGGGYSVILPRPEPLN